MYWISGCGWPNIWPFFTIWFRFQPTRYFTYLTNIDVRKFTYLLATKRCYSLQSVRATTQIKLLKNLLVNYNWISKYTLVHNVCSKTWIPHRQIATQWSNHRTIRFRSDSKIDCPVHFWLQPAVPRGRGCWLGRSQRLLGGLRHAARRNVARRRLISSRYFNIVGPRIWNRLRPHDNLTISRNDKKHAYLNNLLITNRPNGGIVVRPL